VDAFDVWVELQAIDNKGDIVFWSGMVEDNGYGPVEPGAHFYRSLMLDENGNQINKRNTWASRVVAYARLIPPNAADTIRYRVNIPKDCGEQITLKAKVHYRKFAWWNTQWAYAGVPDPTDKSSVTKTHDDRRWVFTGDTSKVSGKMKQIPNLPIITMASNEVTLPLVDENTSNQQVTQVLDKSVRERWNDYGIGLLLQGDIKAAEAIFLKVTQMEPEYVDGWVNVARARIQEGQMEAAAEVLKRALELKPDFAKTHFFMAIVLKAQNQYDKALEHMHVAVKQFPRDRVFLNQTGRLLLLKRQYQEAIFYLNQVLSIDPEDVQTHYNLIQCYQGLGNKEMVTKEEKLYLRFKADESTQVITGLLLKLNSEENNERQSVHEHTSVTIKKIRPKQLANQ
jgi:tetratricopeptide (TPR) repeat protein